MYGVSGNWNHVRDRGIQRLTNEEKRVVNRILYTIAQKIKTRSLPNGRWYRAVIIRNYVAAYICGQGCHVSTILSGDMRPRGRKI